MAITLTFKKLSLLVLGLILDILISFVFFITTGATISLFSILVQFTKWTLLRQLVTTIGRRNRFISKAYLRGPTIEICRALRSDVVITLTFKKLSPVVLGLILDILISFVLSITTRATISLFSILLESTKWALFRQLANDNWTGGSIYLKNLPQGSGYKNRYHRD